MAEAFAASKGGYGYRRVKAMLRTGVSEKVIRRIMAEDGPTAHVPERCGYGSYGGETTPAPGDLADRDFTTEAPDEKWPGWLNLMDRCGLTRSTGAKGCSPDNAAAEGFFGRMKTESVYPGRWEERTRDEVLAPVDDCIRWRDHGRIKRSLGVYGQINVYGVTTKSERHKRSYWTRTADGNGIGGRKAPVPYGS